MIAPFAATLQSYIKYIKKITLNSINFCGMAYLDGLCSQRVNEYLLISVKIGMSCSIFSYLCLVLTEK